MLGQNHQDSCLERFGTYILYVQLVRVSFEIHSWEAELMHMHHFRACDAMYCFNQVPYVYIYIYYFSIILGNSPWKHYSTSNPTAINSFYPWIFYSNISTFHQPPPRFNAIEDFEAFDPKMFGLHGFYGSLNVVPWSQIPRVGETFWAKTEGC